MRRHRLRLSGALAVEVVPAAPAVRCVQNCTQHGGDRRSEQGNNVTLTHLLPQRERSGRNSLSDTQARQECH